MTTKQPLARAVLGSLALVLALSACRGGNAGPSGYVPPATTDATAQAAFVQDDTTIGPDGALIRSNCARLIKLKVAGVLHCRYWERHHPGLTFWVRILKPGIFTVTPLKGTRQTPFTITGLAIGQGLLEIRNGRHRLIVRIHVQS